MSETGAFEPQQDMPPVQSGKNGNSGKDAAGSVGSAGNASPARVAGKLSSEREGAANLLELEGFFQQHLAELANPAQLGIVCARLGVTLADVAPPHLALPEQVQRLLSHLVQRGGARGLLALGNALLADEATAAAASELGLSALLGDSRSAIGVSIAAAAAGSGAGPGSRSGPLPGSCICQPLPPPPAWLGRDAELGALDAHLRTGARIVFLRGTPGAGKSTLLGRWLRELLVSNPLTSAVFDGVLYYSFAHDPDVQSFLRAASEYVCGTRSPGAKEAETGSGGSVQMSFAEEPSSRYYLDRLLEGMKRGSVLLVLDGLERLQRRTLPKISAFSRSAAEGTDSEPVAARRRPTDGDLMEPHLASLLLSLTLGTVRGAVVATISNTIPMLSPWLGSRCIEVDVPPLTPAEGAALLRYSGVSDGPESEVEQRSIEHNGHCLTLYLLGRYLHAYFQGDGRAVTRAELPATDTGLHIGELHDLSGRTGLRPVLRAHLLALPEPARRLLDLCVLLPGPLSVTALQALLDQLHGHLQDQLQSQFPGALPGPLQGPAQRQLQTGVSVRQRVSSGRGLSSAASFKAPTPPAVLLPDSMWLQGPSGLFERLAELEQLGLLHILTAPDGTEAIEIHPLLREPIYREWLNGRGGFWPAPRSEVDGARGYIARGEQALELLEQLVGLLLAAGQPAAAYAVLEERLGGYLHHVHYLGRARRFLSVVRQLYPAVASIALSDPVWQRRYSQLLTWEAETLRVLGQLESALVTAQRQWPLGAAPLPPRLYQQARVLRSLGRLEQAAASATLARQSTGCAFDAVLAATESATICLLAGDPAMCQIHLLDAEALLREEEAQLLSEMMLRELSIEIKRVWARRALYLGHHERARALLEQCRSFADERHSELDGAQCDVLLAELLRQERSYEASGQALHRALTAAGRSGDVETLIHGGLVQGCLRLDTGHLDGAAAAFGPALALSAEHGFGTYRIDLLIWRGALHLRRGDAGAAERDARDALAYATAPGCGYLWGEADALHLLATVLIAGRPPSGSPRHSEAVAHLTDELELRERMSSPAAPEIRWLLRRLRP